MKRTIVISAVNLRKGGTLTILRQTLEYLSRRDFSCLPAFSSILRSPEGQGALREGVRVVALVHDRKLCDYPGIEYVEMPWTVRTWAHRLWAEYVTMWRISRRLKTEDGRSVWLWISLHDTTPRVTADHQEVYCHTSFPFLKLRLRDWFMDPKIPVFAHLTKIYYRINVHRNDAIIVQQRWFAEALSSQLHVDAGKFCVIPPAGPADVGSVARVSKAEASDDRVTFLYASTADCHKNFETLLEAAARLESMGLRFRLTLTIKGDENRYARWLKARWGNLKSVEFRGFMTKDELFSAYRSADVFVFPSRIETWGLPISEFISAHPGAPLILSDLPYAHETASGARASFFNPDDPGELAALMSEHLR